MALLEEKSDGTVSDIFDVSPVRETVSPAVRSTKVPDLLTTEAEFVQEDVVNVVFDDVLVFVAASIDLT